MNREKRVENLRKRVYRTVRQMMGSEPFTGDPRALRSYLEGQLDRASASRNEKRPLMEIAREALRLQLVRSLSPHQQRMLLHRKRIAVQEPQFSVSVRKGEG